MSHQNSLPPSADAFFQLGESLSASGRLDEAVLQYQNALRLDPAAARCHHALGMALAQLGRTDEAERAYRTALRLKPDYAAAHNNLGTVLLQHDRIAEGLKCFREAIRLTPQCAEAHNNQGIALARQGNHEEAIVSFETALKLRGDCAETHDSMGGCLRELGRIDEALAHFRAALRLKPGFAAVFNDMGITYAALNRLDDAIGLFDQAIRMQPDYPAARTNRAIAYLTKGDFERGWPEHEQRLLVKGRGVAEREKGRKGDKEKGRQGEGVGASSTSGEPAGLPIWDGSPLDRRTVLVRHEQGLGDTIQFLRYLAMLKEREAPSPPAPLPRGGEESGAADGCATPVGNGGRVVFECPARLMKLMAWCKGIDELVPQGRRTEFIPPRETNPGDATTTPLSPAAGERGEGVQVSLMSLPYLFGTRMDTIPAQVPYIFPGEELVEAWGHALRHLNAASSLVPHPSPLAPRQIGIAWQGNARFKGDRHRSMPLRHFATLARVPRVQLISLQHGHGREQIEPFNRDLSQTRTDDSPLPTNHSPLILDLGKDLDRDGAFLDTAAIMKNLDLVITSDTAIAHLAGALGVTVWVALPFAPDWRWLLEREDGPWYPTMRLFRQKERGHRAGVFDAMARELAAGAEKAPSPQPLSPEGERGQAVPSHLPLSPAARERGDRMGPYLASALHQVGSALARAGDLGKARECFREVLRLDALSAEAQASLGLIHLQQGRVAEAAEHLQRSVALKPNQPDVLCNLGVAHFRLQRFNEAIAAYGQALRLQPHNAGAHNNLGNALRMIGQLDAAVASLREACRLQSRLPDAHLLLGQVLAQQGKHAEAVPVLRLAVELRPGNAEAHFRLGNSLRENVREEDTETGRQGEGEKGRRGEREGDRLEQAVGCYRESLRLRPAVSGDRPFRHFSFISPQMYQCG